MNSKFWLHYHSLRRAVEVFVVLGAAVLCGYLILRTQG